MREEEEPNRGNREPRSRKWSERAQRMGKAMENRGMRDEHRTRQQERKSPCESTYDSLLIVFKLRKILGESRPKLFKQGCHCSVWGLELARPALAEFPSCLGEYSCIPPSPHNAFRCVSELPLLRSPFPHFYSPSCPFRESSQPQLSKSPRLQFLVRVYMTPAELMACTNAVSRLAGEPKSLEG